MRRRPASSPRNRRGRWKSRVEGAEADLDNKSSNDGVGGKTDLEKESATFSGQRELAFLDSKWAVSFRGKRIAEGANIFQVPLSSFSFPFPFSSSCIVGALTPPQHSSPPFYRVVRRTSRGFICSRASKADHACHHSLRLQKRT